MRRPPRTRHEADPLSMFPANRNSEAATAVEPYTYPDEDFLCNKQWSRRGIIGGSTPPPRTGKNCSRKMMLSRSFYFYQQIFPENLLLKIESFGLLRDRERLLLKLPENFRKFGKLLLRKVKKCIIIAVYKIFYKPFVNFHVFGRKHIVMKFLRKFRKVFMPIR